MYIWIFTPLILAILLYYKYRKQINYELQCSNSLNYSEKQITIPCSGKTTRREAIPIPVKSMSFPLIENQNHEQHCSHIKRILPVKNISDSSKTVDNFTVAQKEDIPAEGIVLKVTEKSTTAQVALEKSNINDQGIQLGPSLPNDIKTKTELQIPLVVIKHEDKDRKREVAKIKQVELNQKTEISASEEGSLESESMQNESVCQFIPHSPVLDVSHFLKHYNAKKKKKAKKRIK